MLERIKWALPLLLSSTLARASCDEMYAEEDCTPCCSVCNCSGSFGAGGDWLYLCPLITSISYARVFELGSFGNLTGIIVDTKNQCFETKHNAGFDIFAYYRSPLYCADFKWEIKGSFLSHRMRNRIRRRAGGPPYFQPTLGFIPQQSANAFLSVVPVIQTDLNILNGEFGGVFDQSGRDHLHIFAGVQCATLHTSLKATYTETFLPIAPFSATETCVRELSRFHGIGPRVGFQGNLPLFYGISIVCDFATSLLFSKKSGSLYQETFVGQSGSVAPQSDLRLTEDFCTSRLITAGMEALVGLKFDLSFWDCFTLGVQGGYRALYYWDAATYLEIASNFLFTQGEIAGYRDSPSIERSVNFGLSGWFIGGSLQF